MNFQTKLQTIDNYLLDKAQRLVDKLPFKVAYVLNILVGWRLFTIVFSLAQKESVYSTTSLILILFTVIIFTIATAFIYWYEKLPEGETLMQQSPMFSEFIPFVRIITGVFAVIYVLTLTPTIYHSFAEGNNLKGWSKLFDLSTEFTEVLFWYLISTAKTPPRNRQHKREFSYE